MNKKLANIIKEGYFNICIYHKGCNDGIAAFWCMKKYGQNFNIIGIPAYHGYNIDKDIIMDKKVILLDICLEKEKMEDLIKSCKYVVVVDHHDKALNIKQNIDSAISTNLLNHKQTFDLLYGDKSICQTIWNILNPEVAEPNFITYIGRRDLNLDWNEKAHWFVVGWREKFKDLTYDTVDILFLNDNLIEKIIQHGQNQLRANIKKYKALIEKSEIIKFLHNDKYYNIKTYKTCGIDKSEFGTYVCKMDSNIDFVVVYSGKPGNQRASLRSNKDSIDLRDIAYDYGGGGHKSAVGIVGDIENIFSINLRYQSNIYLKSVILLGVILTGISLLKINKS